MDRSEIDRACVNSEAADKMLREVSAPFLVKTNEQYEVAKPRVVVVGQETNGWLGLYKEFLDRNTIIDALSTYESFDFGRMYNSTFFQYFDRIRNSIFGANATKDSRKVILWLNLFKFFHGSMIRSPHLEAVLNLQADVFQQELKLLKPDVVIFLTGPNYDCIIRRFYPNVLPKPLEVYSERQVAQLVHRDLPSLTFRTYHPGYLNRFKKKTEHCLPAILKRVLDAIQGQRRYL